MAIFLATVERVNEIFEHPNADRLEIIPVRGYQCVVSKGEYFPGDLFVYIPEQSIVPINILKEIGLEGHLAGKAKNRVRATRIRGILSQGICYPSRKHWTYGDDVTKELGIEKWEPAIPLHLAGEVYSAGKSNTVPYDIENIKNFPCVLNDNEPVIFTEKIHGTFLQVGVLPKFLSHPKFGGLVVSTKNMSAQGISLKYDAAANKQNLYVRVARHLSLENRVRSVYRSTITQEHKDPTSGKPVFIFGEIFGQKVQDLTYGAKIDKDAQIGFRVFDIFIGHPLTGYFLNDDELDTACIALGLQRVPIIYRGPYSKDILKEHTTGIETVSGKNIHVREGVVVRPQIERKDDILRNTLSGRVQLKSVSADYLCRRGKTTEYN